MGGHETSRVVYTYKKPKGNKVLEYVRCHFVNAACGGDSAGKKTGGGGRRGRIKRVLPDPLGCNCSKDRKTEEELVSAVAAQRGKMIPISCQVCRSVHDSTLAWAGTHRRKSSPIHCRSIASVKTRTQGRTRTIRITTKEPSAVPHLPLCGRQQNVQMH